LDFKVKVSRLLFCVGLVPAFLSCQSNFVEDSNLITGVSFPGKSETQLKENLFYVEKEHEKFAFEQDWLNLRSEVVRSEISANEAMKSLLKLEIELLKFKKLQEDFPDEKGFITDLQEIEWQARLKFKNEQINKLRANVRLLKRDMKDLEAKLHRHGFDSVEKTIFTRN
jgi:hypothetical protein